MDARQVSFTSPYAADEAEILRRQRMAEMLQAQAQQPLGGTEMAGNIAIRRSPLEGLAQMGKAASARSQMEDVQRRRNELSERIQGDRSADMQAMVAAMQGSPGGMEADAADNVTQMPARPAGQMDPAIMGTLRSPDMQNIALKMMVEQMQPKKPMVVGRSLLDPSGKVIGQDATWQAEQAETRKGREAEAEARRAEAQRAEQARFDQQRSMAQIAAGSRQPNQEQIINTAEGPMRIVNGQAVPITGPGGAQVKPAAGRGGQMTATAQKELIETEEQLQGGQSALDLFKQARAINNKAMGGFGAGAIATAGTILPDALRPETVDATQNLDNILQTAALPQLKAIFGGMPTEGERKILLDVQGSSSKPAKVREEIFGRAEKAIQARIKFAGEKAKRLREGTYFSGDGLPSLQAPAGASNPQDAAALEWANANPNDPRSAKIKQRLGQ